MKMLRLIKLADLFTIGNLACGVLSVFLSAWERYAESAWLLFIAVALDTLDGKIAHALHQQNVFGRELDSLADVVSFGVAPAFLFFSVGPQTPLNIIILVFFVACGMLRLARYNISSGSGFEGVPITVNGILFPAFYLLTGSAPEFRMLWPALFALQGLLMVSSFRVKRLF